MVETDFMVDYLSICPDLGDDLHRPAPPEAVD